MATDSTAIRVRAATKRRLEDAIKAYLYGTGLNGADALSDDEQGLRADQLPISMDRFINHLLDQRDGKATRRNASKRRRASARRAGRPARMPTPEGGAR